MITPLPTQEEERASLIGKEVKLFGNEFSPEASQPGPRVRVSFLGQWELTGGEA